MREIAIIGATFSGNKGAASMLQAGLDLIPEYVDDAHFNVLSVYPGADRRLNRDDRVDVVPAKPWQLMLMTPLALVGRVLPPALKLMPALRALKRSDLLIDVGGL
ncbi:MAG: polysaccharide pyruvyl transferase family protein, partial [Anaerolineae bacterium]|nr:polysaccharide pyruvyl transferase family protein [Anaerolineae bacterium]